MTLRVNLAENIDTLDAAGELADCYEPAECGGFTLTAAAREHLERVNADLAKYEADSAVELAAKDADIRQMRSELDDLIRQRVIGAALNNAAVNPKMRPMVEAYLHQTLPVEIEHHGDGRHTVRARGQGDVLMTVDHAVAQFLASETGSVFAPAKPTMPTDGFAAAIRRLLH